jgi:hypothetical protein
MIKPSFYKTTSSFSDWSSLFRWPPPSPNFTFLIQLFPQQFPWGCSNLTPDSAAPFKLNEVRISQK